MSAAQRTDAADPQVVTSMCRLCLAYCGIRVTIENERAAHVTGDVDNPLSRGFTCAKGRTLPEQLANPNRLLHSVARAPDGEYRRIAVNDLVEQVAGRLGDILERHGSRSVATYFGTGSAAYAASMAMGGAFMAALGSPMLFHPGTIDQPGKQIAMSLHGRWSGGSYDFATADVWMFIGTNPIVSMWGGLSVTDPIRSLKEARRRGMRIVVVDPRRTELASLADVHLRPRPGEDAVLLAGLVRAVLASERHDRAFVSEHAEGVAELERAVERFTPTVVEARTGVAAQQQQAAVEVLLSSRRGCITAGTGANMTPHGTLAECLALSLHTLCGYWRRAGERVTNPGALVPQREFHAEAEPAPPAFGPATMLARPLRQTSAGMPTAALADEMLYDGADRVRAFINLGGNPVAAWPDQLKTIDAMRALDLLVCFDIRMSATARLADYVVASKFALEVPQLTGAEGSINMYGATSTQFQVPYAMYSPAVVAPPPDAEVVEEWEVLLAVAGRLGLTVPFGTERLEPGAKPTTDELYEMLFPTTRVPLGDVKRHEHGHVFDDGPPVFVESRRDGHDLRLQLAHPTMLEALQTLDVDGSPSAPERFPFRLISRRMKNAKNSSGLDVEALFPGGSVNPAFANPDQLRALGLRDGAVVRIRSERSWIPAIVASDETVPMGVISMSHAWGDGPEHDSEFRRIGSCTSRLIDSEKSYDPVTGMPVMTAVPVTIEQAPD